MTTGFSRYRLTLKYPASWWGQMWREGLPSGNGTIGASVYGGVKDETVLINHAELWHWGHKDPLPDVSHTLQEMRAMMNEGKYREASWHLTNALKEQGYDTKLASRLPLVDLKVSMPCRNAFKGYRRSVNMETGEVTVRWKDGPVTWERTLFVSRADDAVVYELRSDGEPIEALIRLAFHKSENANMAAKCKELEESAEAGTEGPFMFYANRNDDGTDYGAVLRVAAENGEALAVPGGIQVCGASRVLVLAKVFVKSERGREWKRLKQELAEMDADYDELLKRHVQLHAELFHSAGLRLETGEREATNEEWLLEAYDGEAPAAMIERLWAYGRYLFISGTAALGQPFGLYGLWWGDYRLMWGHNMANENVQMMYWHAPVGGLTGLMPALFRYYGGMLEDFRENARRLYGCRGIYAPAGSTPGIGVPNQIVPVIMNWTGAAGWLARHYYEYYLYTGDETFLREQALPFMREAALFYEDFLTEEEGGCFKFYPSVSPENTPQNFMPPDGKQLAHPMPTAINATMDFAILKELLTHLVEGSRAVGMYADERERWEAMLAKIPPYQINGDGAVREWMHPDFDDRYDHRHLSHLYPVFPGQELTREDDPELFGAFETAVRKRLIGAQSGWSLTHMASIYARLGDGNKALECLEILARSCLLNNFFTLHNDWRNMGICMNDMRAPIQMDANMGWINAVQEMLLYVSPRMIKLLPALPDKWSRGEASDFRFCTGRISISWDREKGSFTAVLMAERPTELALRLPDGFGRFEFAGEGTVQSPEPGSPCHAVRMEPGQTLRISSVQNNL